MTNRTKENEIDWHAEERLVEDELEKTKSDMSSSDPRTRNEGEKRFARLIPAERSNGYPPCTERIAHRRH